MKLCRYGPLGQEKPALVDTEGDLRDLSSIVHDIGPEVLVPAGLGQLAQLEPDTLPLLSGTPRMGACVAHVGKFVCIGLNYRDHADETGAKYPEEPVIFMKATSAIIGPNDTVVIPRDSHKTDWEVELGVVIGAHAKYVSEAEALEYVAGYCVVNDLSEREFQMERGGQWDKGKGCDTFGPLGRIS